MDFPSALYFLYFHYFGLAVAHSHFSTSHTAHGFGSSLFPGSFRLVYFLKAHLLILWACNPLFLPFGFNGFSIHLLTFFCPCCWASSFYWASKDDHQQSCIFHMSYRIASRFFPCIIIIFCVYNMSIANLVYFP